MSVTLVIIIITVVVSMYAFSNQSVHRDLMMHPYSVAHSNQWYRVISHAFVHKDYMHLFFNMFVLYQFGYHEIQGYGATGAEAKLVADMGGLGRYLYILLYLGGFLSASIPSLLKHRDNPNYYSLGASGAVSAVVFAMIVLYPTSKMGLIFLPGIALPAVVFGALYIAYEMYMDKCGGTGIAHDAHLWGALFGIVFIIVINFDYLRTFIDEIKDLF